MKAELEQIPVSENRDNGQKPQSKPAMTGTIWAHIRRIESRLDAIEGRVSTVRRDCDRIEKKLSREANEISLQQLTEEPERVKLPGLYG